MFCTNCGAQIDDDQNFCTNCGTKVEAIEEYLEPELQGVGTASIADVIAPSATHVKPESEQIAPVPFEVGNSADGTTVLADAEKALKEEAKAKIETATFSLIDSGGKAHVATSFPCTFGKGTASDVQISGNNAISREHIRVTFDSGKFFVEDLGSSNYTFLHGEQLDPEVEVEVISGDEIKLADEPFTIQAYF